METSVQSKRVYRFGLFEAYTNSGELLRRGMHRSRPRMSISSSCKSAQAIRTWFLDSRANPTPANSAF